MNLFLTEIGAEEELIVGGQAYLGCAITFRIPAGTIAEHRGPLTAALEYALPNVQVWPYIPAETPHTPAVILRRNAHAARATMEGVTQPSMDAICVTDMADVTRTADMDDLVDLVVDALRSVDL